MRRYFIVVLLFWALFAWGARRYPRQLPRGMDARTGAEMFHGTLIAGLAEWTGAFARAEGQTDVVLGGGCLMNRVLAEGLAAALRARGLAVWLARAVPCNDGGISLGQAAMARVMI